MGNGLYDMELCLYNYMSTKSSTEMMIMLWADIGMLQNLFYNMNIWFPAQR